MNVDSAVIIHIQSRDSITSTRIGPWIDVKSSSVQLFHSVIASGIWIVSLGFICSQVYHAPLNVFPSRIDDI